LLLDCRGAARIESAEFVATLKTTSLSVLVLLLAASSAWAQKDTCFDCHMVRKGPSQIFKDDVHYKSGISCVNCHGGDPNDDGDSSMSAAKGFKPRPTRETVNEFCGGTCHSDAALMGKYTPGQRVDQLALYRKSGHGLLFAQGNTDTALCIDCHTTHNIRVVNDPQSAVSPSRIADTCGGFGCHDAVLKESTHAKVFAIKGMAACSVCHSSHGPE
jgi:cytochrome c553